MSDSKFPEHARGRLVFAVATNALTLLEALETLREVTTMPTVAHPILGSTTDSPKENES